ncbi:MAG: adenylate kinase, partial [Candidatus Fraserbacteria bacterium RBG_16_55_9]
MLKVLAHGGKRIAVIGTTGSGKTTLAQQLAGCLGVLHVELDALHWGAGWSPAPLEIFRERVSQSLKGDGWVVDGNYSKVRDIVWSRADTIVWLDYSFWVIIRRVIQRTFRRLLRQEELWNGNRERWRDQFLSRESLFLWVLRTYWRRRREYPLLLREPEYAHLAVVHLRSPMDAQEWLARIAT